MRANLKIDQNYHIDSEGISYVAMQGPRFVYNFLYYSEYDRNYFIDDSLDRGNIPGCVFTIPYPFPQFMNNPQLANKHPFRHPAGQYELDLERFEQQVETLPMEKRPSGCWKMSYQHFYKDDVDDGRNYLYTAFTR
ncbi:uncharacterized protein DSM5745_04987 [Aspergillus mulundensis]|uniref:Uncharacterized protein n=1 Tax=Aspergillus mulundensis TaxID=1810919 RepID=A0A3D8S5F9_9EURO|nr:hypothetical protein DSM5745_04987 [Aspergillus mulundensis]RDW81430.1 hypothetical protein DSM5745_04987 [Aspergillus mulundensis]